MKRVLVTGGLGFIGSHIVVELLKQNFSVLIVDNLGNCHYDTLKRIRLLSNVEEGNDEILYDVIGDLTKEKDVARVKAAMTIYPCDAVIHLAAWKSVSDSVKNPDEYYRNNLGSLLSVLTIMRDQNVKHMVFSSSATVYGPSCNNSNEDFPCDPINPYGKTKWIGEIICQDFCQSYKDVKIIAARYMNPVGKHPSGILPEKPLGPPMNLFPVINEVLTKKREFLEIFGGDYKTRDGTAERDYVHVVDVAEAHVEMIRHLLKENDGPNFDVINIGTGNGHTVLEVVFAMEKIHGQNSVPYRIVSRREGDVESLVVSVEKAKRVLGWKAKLTLCDMCK